MKIAVLKERRADERRVAATPETVKKFVGLGVEIMVEAGAGAAAHFSDDDFQAAGAVIAADPAAALSGAGVVLKVRRPIMDDEDGENELAAMSKGQALIAMLNPLIRRADCEAYAQAGVNAYAMELMPRITRAQGMDVLSSQANLAGYKSVLDATEEYGRAMPMMMTAAGTIAPARVFIVGAGVAGLQAIASARRLGAKVEAYDVRPAVKEQVQSLGATFLDLPLDTDESEDQGGYAKAQDERFYARQREMMSRVVAGSDVVVTTALIPGRPAPVLVTDEMVAGMPHGAVVVDLAAERGGNVEPSRPDETVVAHGVTVLGPTNLPATVPYHASQMYAKNVSTFLLHLVEDGMLQVDLEDEITRSTLVSRAGEVVHPRVRDLLAPPD